MRRLWWLGGGAILAFFVALSLAQTGSVASDFWRDFVTWFSLFLTGLGLGYTVYQVTLIESAARVARAAALEAKEESRRRIFQFTAASIHHLINAVSDDLERHEWGKAVIRLNNLADYTAQIGGQEAEWAQMVRQLREAASECQALESERRRRVPYVKWIAVLTTLRVRLDTFFGPLRTD